MINPDELKFGDKVTLNLLGVLKEDLLCIAHCSGYVRCINRYSEVNHYRYDELILGWGEE